MRAVEVLRPVAQSRDVAFLLNDRPDLAVRSGCDGAHVGQDDLKAADARKLLGDLMLGVTCHDSRDLAMQAGEAGADYVAFGAFYPTTTKTPPTMADPDLLRWWSEMMELPCVAIGGITVDNCSAAGHGGRRLPGGVERRVGPSGRAWRGRGAIRQVDDRLRQSRPGCAAGFIVASRGDPLVVAAAAGAGDWVGAAARRLVARRARLHHPTRAEREQRYGRGSPENRASYDHARHTRAASAPGRSGPRPRRSSPTGRTPTRCRWRQVGRTPGQPGNPRPAANPGRTARGGGRGRR